ncbi:MAG: HlyC/CorC family transporter [Deltaproteobacteria bacterium]|jgi:putative hemolysin|nr:HlyC/CorC family transporter [Deltaproteobacteria bacterium]
MSLGSEVLIILILIIANGVFAMSEIAVISSRKERLQQWIKEGHPKAKKAMELASEPSHFLSTVQVGITLIGILAGAFGGATVAEKIKLNLLQYPALTPYAASLSLFIVVLLITYFSLIIGELVPKRLALSYPERIATLIAGPMSFLARLASPLVHFLSLSTEIILRLLRIHPPSSVAVTPEEIKVLIDHGTRMGIFEEVEQDLVESVFRLGDRKASVLMTPRAEIIWVDADLSFGDNWYRIQDSGHSQFPVCQGSLENILGIVTLKHLILPMVRGESPDMKQNLIKPLFVHEGMTILKVLELFKQSSNHIALVVDEYGSTQGLVTLHDIMEAIVGVMPGTEGESWETAVRREDGSWLLDGMLPADELKEIFNIAKLPEEERGDYQTLGGFVMMHMGRIPSPADYFDWEGLRFEIMDMDGHRVDKVLVTPAPRGD